MTQDQMDEAITEDRMHTMGFRGFNDSGWLLKNKRWELQVMRLGPKWGALKLPLSYDGAEGQEQHTDGWNNIVRFDCPVAAAVYLLSLGDL